MLAGAVRDKMTRNTENKQGGKYIGLHSLLFNWCEVPPFVEKKAFVV